MNRGQLVSVIVTTKNEDEVIERLIRSIKNQAYQSKEIIVVDNYSTDQTAKLAKKMGVRVYFRGPERSSQRNFGASRAKGIYFLFIDADMELSPEVLDECIEVCDKDPRIGAVIIPERSLAGNFWEKVKAFERSFYNLEGDNTTDAARFTTRKAYFQAGGYDEAITGPEDWDLAETIKKLGFKIARISALIYHHEEIPSPFDLARKKFYYAIKSHRYLSKQRISVFSPKTIYFLRPVFYRHFNRILAHPLLSLGMIFLLLLELLAGGAGYLTGRIRKL